MAAGELWFPFFFFFLTNKATGLVLQDGLVILEEFTKRSRAGNCVCERDSKRAGDKLSGRKGEEEGKKVEQIQMNIV